VLFSEAAIGESFDDAGRGSRFAVRFATPDASFANVTADPSGDQTV